MHTHSVLDSERKDMSGIDFTMMCSFSCVCHYLLDTSSTFSEQSSGSQFS